MSSRASGLTARFRAGAVDAVAFVPSVLILGMIFGASATSTGISPLAVGLMSAIVWSGSGQFAALPLWHEGGMIVVLSVLALSLRFTLITASMAHMLVRAPSWVRAALAFCVTDENYALAVTRQKGALAPAYLLGSWIPLYLAWVVGTVLGLLVGTQVPAAWVAPLRAVFPMVFLVLTVLLCTSTHLALVAGLGGVLSILGALYLPPGWNVIAAGVAASLCGVLLDRFRGRT